MARRSVTVTGDEAAIRSLLAKGRCVFDLDREMGYLAEYSEGQITRVPVDTGRLRSSLSGGPGSSVRVTNDGFELGTTVPYAKYNLGDVRVNASAIGREASSVIDGRIQQEGI